MCYALFFMVRFLTRQIMTQNDVVLFSFTRIFSTGFFYSKVLMRHIIEGHTSGVL